MAALRSHTPHHGGADSVRRPTACEVQANVEAFTLSRTPALRDAPARVTIATPPNSDTAVHLVLLPGMDGTEILFAPLPAALPNWLRVQVVTYPSEGGNGYEDLLPPVLAAVTRLPNCFVLGWSFSGPLALQVAALLPDRVRGVILGASFVLPPNRWLPRLRFLLRPGVVGCIRFLRRLPLWLGTPADSLLRRAKA